jgi:hypothetical protein
MAFRKEVVIELGFSVWRPIREQSARSTRNGKKTGLAVRPCAAPAGISPVERTKSHAVPSERSRITYWAATATVAIFDDCPFTLTTTGTASPVAALTGTCTSI